MERSGSVSEVPPTERLEALLFELSGQRFAVSLDEVVELTRACAVQALPKAPRPVLGVLNLRGAIVPVLDLRQRFELPETPLDPSNYFVFARVAARRVALRVDRILGIEWLDSVPSTQTSELAVRTEHLSGVAAVADGVVLIYDLASFLSHAEASELDGALAQRSIEGRP
jgi:purine-binding chemotaxis protein CheW